MVIRLIALRDEALAHDNELLAQLLEVALIEAERIVELRTELTPRRYSTHMRGRAGAIR